MVWSLPTLPNILGPGSDKHDWVELAGGDWLMKNIQDAWVLWI